MSLACVRGLRGRLTLDAPACLAALALVVSCEGTDAGPDGTGVEVINRMAVTYPAVGFSARPAGVPSNVIGLTFDDGPDEINTPRVLDVLAQKGVKATFFINTNNWGNVETSATLKNIIKRIVADGHQLASHTVGHLHLPQLSTAEIEAQVTGVQTIVNRSDVLGAAYPKLTMLRAPFGEPYQTSAPGSADYDKVAPIVGRYAVHMGWAIDTFDYNCAAGDSSCVVNNFKAAVNGGSYGMVLMHSVHAQTAGAIAEIIDFCRSRNTVFWLGEQFVQAAFGGKTSNEVIYGTTPPTCTQTPFGGAARAIPGTVQAEDFDNGGNDCGYLDTTTGNNGASYRTTESVDIQATGDTGGGFNIGWVAAGEYLDYTVSVGSAGNYRLELRTATTAAGKTVDVSVGGVLVADNLAVTNTGSYQSYATISVPSVALTAGSKELRVLFNQGSVNLNWIRFTAVTTGGPQTFSFEAESGAGLASPMVVVNEAAASGGKAIWNNSSSSNSAPPSNGRVRFTFTVATAGAFKVWGRFLVGPATTSDDSLWARLDGAATWTQWNDIHPRIGNAGYAWDAERDTPGGNALVTRSLAAGSHTLEVAYRENGLKIDRLVVTSDPAFVPPP
jgi:peptidoglycan/xylan/chitin deacetylase (PgdA/CDA1 family)